MCAQVYGRRVAVHNLTLPLRVNEMTALLGHNGAGAPPFWIILVACALYVNTALKPALDMTCSRRVVYQLQPCVGGMYTGQ